MTCDQARMLALALADGETSGVPREDVEQHLEGCPLCRGELAGLSAIEGMWRGTVRRRHRIDLWPGIERRLARRWRRSVTALGVLLVSFRCLELFPDRQLGAWAQLVPIGAAVAVFVVLRLNPFQISTERLLSQEEP